MSKIKRILDQHSIETKLQYNRLYALESYTINGVYGEDWIDTTGWTTSKLALWLGY